MKKIIYLFALSIGAVGCSVDSLDSEEQLTVADAQIKIQEAQKSMNLKSPETCEGEAPVFVFNFPQNMAGPNIKETDIQIQVLDTVNDDWLQFKKISYAGAGPEEFSYTDEELEKGKYYFRASIGSGGFDYYATLEVVRCVECEESFTYVDNGNGTYTFSYTAGEDMEDAEVVFTFAQGAYNSGLSSEFSQNGNNGQSYKALMDLEKCDFLEYTVTLTPNCSGSSKESNVWTDFKINDASKKANEEDKFVASCN